MSSSSSDINECVQEIHNCGAHFECVNTEGSFRCNPKPQCPVGFSQDAQGNCKGRQNYVLLSVIQLLMSAQHCFSQSGARSWWQVRCFWSVLQLSECSNSGSYLIKLLFGLDIVTFSTSVSLHKGETSNQTSPALFTVGVVFGDSPSRSQPQNSPPYSESCRSRSHSVGQHAGGSTAVTEGLNATQTGDQRGCC